MKPLNETCAALDALKFTLAVIKTEQERKAITVAVFKAIIGAPVKTSKQSNGSSQFAKR